MNYRGNLLKMRTENTIPVSYFLNLENTEINMTQLLGTSIQLNYHGCINCIKCAKKINKSFGQGYCFPCFISVPETESCVLRPETCLAHEGVARDMEYAKSHCLIDHFVYLSYTSKVKVGITRHNQIPTRWIDQGATSAIKIAQTPNRYLAGVLEVALKKYYADKTHWSNMLKSEGSSFDLQTEKNIALGYLDIDLREYEIYNEEVTEIKFPVIKYPEKVKSISFEKENSINGVLSGIKGQYLIFEDGKVINIRTHSGFYIELITN